MVSSGLVISQSVEADTQAEKGSAITIVVSLGAKPAAQQSQPQAPQQSQPQAPQQSEPPASQPAGPPAGEPAQPQAPAVEPGAGNDVKVVEDDGVKVVGE